MSLRHSVQLVLDVAVDHKGLRLSFFEKSQHVYRTVSPLYYHPVHLDRLNQLHSELTQALNHSSRMGDADRSSALAVRQYGQLLFDELLPIPVKDKLRRIVSGDLVLVIDEELVFLPWELLHTGHGFLSLLFNVGRVVRTRQSVSGQPRPTTPEKAKSLLVLCDPRDDLMASYYEGIALRDQLDSHQDKIQVGLRAGDVDREFVRQVFRDFDIVHYAGHADTEPTAEGKVGWRLSDGTLTAEEIMKMAGGQPLPLLVFANACSSGQISRFSVDSTAETNAYSLASAFLLSGVQHYIGTLWDVPDASACQFALAFYRALSNGETIGHSIMAARAELISRHGDDSVQWASYVLYGDPTMRLFPKDGFRRLDDSNVVHLPPPIPKQPVRSQTAEAAISTTSRPKMRNAAMVAESSPRGWRFWLQSSAFPISAAVAAVVLGYGLLVHNDNSDYHREVTIDPVPLSQALMVPQPVGLLPIVTVPQSRTSRLDVDAQLISRGWDANGLLNQTLLPDGATLNADDVFQLRLDVSRPAHVRVIHLSDNGAMDVRSLEPNAWIEWPTTDENTITLPDDDAWYYVSKSIGVDTFVVCANSGPMPLDQQLLSDLDHIRNRIIREAPEVHVDFGRRVGLEDQIESQTNVVSVATVDRQRLSYRLEQRARQSCETVVVRSLYRR
ncbi:MAG: CHAT domain-containing protein [Myxococcales bacterium]|nr:CHAT domain-containing protein [Myxococcales bacterium]